MVWRALVAPHSLYQILWFVDSSLMEHSGRRAARWIAVWRLLEKQEDELHERIVEQNVDMPVPQITVPVPFQEEIVEVIKHFPAERISERTIEQAVDAPVPQILEEHVEVVKAGSAAHLAPQDRIFREDL